MGDSLDNIDQSIDTTQAIVSIADHKSFCNYLRKAILVLFDDDQVNSSKLDEALDDNRGHQECIKKFLSDPQVQTLYIQKSSSKGKSEFFTIFIADFQNGDVSMTHQKKKSSNFKIPSDSKYRILSFYLTKHNLNDVILIYSSM
jgi:hypothetical protein